MDRLVLLLAMAMAYGQTPVSAALTRCEAVTEPLCQHRDIGYNQTIMPNLYNQQKQLEARRAVPQWLRDLPEESQCARDARQLVCYTLFPVCTILETTVPPCRKVCVRAQESCGELMERNGYQWPEGLRCETLPEERHGMLCVTPPETIDTDGRMSTARPDWPDRRVPVIPTPRWSESTVEPRTTTARPATSTAEPAGPLSHLWSLWSALASPSDPSGPRPSPSSTAADVESALGPIRDMLERLQRIAQLQEENMRLQQEKLRLEIQLLQRKFPREQ
ncbi:Frizzled-7-A [Amphibalanus amphitrite]|uniref:Frizzled-7-A n=1 Tax=Amphibalanus amphitrite TaxID=1232801 RepID=A0A6A4WL25_AMPAM|nr:Frizzled-7-A [Amphibalanus amphitrite]